MPESGYIEDALEARGCGGGLRAGLPDAPDVGLRGARSRPPRRLQVGRRHFAGKIAAVEQLSPSTIRFAIDLDEGAGTRTSCPAST
jgi:benzoate/toluate 1,2-dioxygenase reductase subunit